ncbi:glycosyltransferase [Sulfitobacter noctilucae]|uniref:glycosyltransferase n=1 Tax=Sulfitobacter noctilucae TaxID=1342302 RepID=UPI001376EC09|nr:glycosyltransferase [Sulfitobacter noctilucae]
MDKTGLRGFRGALMGLREWPVPDRLSKVSRGRNKALTQAETEIRQTSLARSLPIGLRRMLAANLGSGFTYYNVGHSNLTQRVMRSTKAAGGRVEVLIHDVIPLEFPEYQRPGTVKPFADKLDRVRRYADRIIYNSEDTRVRTQAVLQAQGPMPPSIVAHLGTIDPVADVSALPEGLLPNRPYFVTVGTIEPRKNHAFLLDLWDEMGADAPPLLICGSRGWNNETVFARLDALPPDGPVQEISGLTDPALNALIKGSAGLLFPSHAEGFGLPPVEALMLGTRVLCNDLRVLHEILREYGTFSPVFDKETWLNTIKCWENTPPNIDEKQKFVAPDWSTHFKTVLRLSC